MSGEFKNQMPKTLAIIGVGLIGGSLGLCLKEKLGDEIFITGLCRTEKSMRRAFELGAVDFASSDVEKVVGDAEIIFLSPPVLQIIPEVKKILPPDIYYIAGHPMTGREKSGVTAAKKDLFKNKAYVIAEKTGAPPEVHEKLMRLLRLTEANFLEIDISEHDRCAAIISHVPHVTAAALVTLLNRAGNDLNSCLKLIGGGFKDTTRIASSNADMWADICMTNPEEISAGLEDLQNILGEVVKAIKNRDRQAVHDYFAKSKERRDEILEKVEKKFDPKTMVVFGFFWFYLVLYGREAYFDTPAVDHPAFFGCRKISNK